MSSNKATDKKGEGTQKGMAAASLVKEIEEIANTDFESSKKLDNFSDFYHAINDIIEKLNEKQGAIQLKLPTKDNLRTAYDKHAREGKNMGKDKFKEIINEIITLETVKVGKSALETIFFIFGAPIGSLFLKKFLPGGGSISDDIFLPDVTSLTVLVLAKTNRL